MADHVASAPGAIAIVGMACRLPGAADIDAFWSNLRDGVESITRLSRDDLLAAGLAPSKLDDPSVVPVMSAPPDYDAFDAAFFGYNAREASAMDPQHRIFLECAWTALQHAGYHAERSGELIGVFGGCGANHYLMSNLSGRGIANPSDELLGYIGNERDFLCTRVSHKLDLHGPSITVQTACSTSLVAVHLACQSLLSAECDMALAGGVTLNPLLRRGYRYHEGGIHSPDGHCRSYDQNANGTVPANGAAVVVLERLEDAIERRDTIYAVIRGSAVNNDGVKKVGFTAPNVDAQTDCVAAAIAMAGLSADDVTYVEGHGTATRLGDPIEIAALTAAFRRTSKRKRYCAIGSLKSNVGHLDTAAGAAGLLKATLALRNRVLPPSLHYERAGVATSLDESPFHVVTAATPWTVDADGVRRAGVSSLGFGGTNCHVIAEEAPSVAPLPPGRAHHVLAFSARSREALEALTDAWAKQLLSNEGDLADEAFTSQLGRRAFTHRRAFVCDERAAAAAQLRDPHRLRTGVVEAPPELVFMFPGQGSQKAGMARALYRSEADFRHHWDECNRAFVEEAGLDLRELMDCAAAAESEDRIGQTAWAQPLLFAFEHALASTLIGWGIRPASLLGHSLGEYVAATLAGIFTLRDAAKLVAIRGRLMQALPPGAMLSVALSEQEALLLANDDVAVAAVNTPHQCVLSGPESAMAAIADALSAKGVSTTRLRTSHAFHSSMMDPILDAFGAEVAKITLKAPTARVLSNSTGNALTTDLATKPSYWVSHLRRTIRFGDNIASLRESPNTQFVEVGPGSVLSGLARANAVAADRVVRCLPKAGDPSEPAALLDALASLWVRGVDIDWDKFHGAMPRRRVAVPMCPLERRRYWVEPPDPLPSQERSRRSHGQANDSLHVPSWIRATPIARRALDEGAWVVMLDPAGVTRRLAERLEQHDRRVVRVEPGARFTVLGDRAYAIAPDRPEDHEQLLRDVAARVGPIAGLVHAFGLAPASPQASPGERFEAAQRRGFFSASYAARALALRAAGRPVELWLVTEGVHDVTGHEPLSPENATSLGLARCVTQEHANVRCCAVDIELRDGGAVEGACASLEEELLRGPMDRLVALRGRQRWVSTFAPLSPPASRDGSPLRRRGVYLILGLGQLGRLFAERLAAEGARLALLAHGPSGAPPESARRFAASLEARGTEVLLASGDVADRERLRSLVRACQQKFGELHGVIHAAGATGPRWTRPIEDVSTTAAQEHFHSRAHGLYALRDALTGVPIDFCMLTSSLASVLGGLHFSAYAAAAHFMNAFACEQRRQTGDPWIAVSWDAWSFESEATQHGGLRSRTDDGWSASEGWSCLLRILSSASVPHVVAAADLPARLHSWQQVAGGEPAVRGAPATPAHPRPEVSTAYAPPRTPTEQALVRIWEDLLATSPVGIRDDFFELGGTSILFPQLLLRARTDLAVHVAARDLFETPTIEAVAERLDAAPREVPRRGEPTNRQTDESSNRTPTSLQQEKMWRHHQRDPTKASERVVGAVRLRATLQIEPLRQALADLCARHDALRTSFTAIDEQPMQIVHDEPLFGLDVFQHRHAEVDPERLRAELQRPWDLSVPPLFRVLLFLTPGETSILVFDLHHIIADQGSLAIVFEELTEIYLARLQGRPPSLPMPAPSYLEFARWQRAKLSTEWDTAAYWRAQLEAPVRTSRVAPDHRPTSSKASFAGRTRSYQLDAALSESIRAFSRSHGFTPFVVLLAAFKLLVARWTDSHDLAIPCPVSGRSRPELQRLVGFVANIVVVRTELEDELPLRDYLARVRTRAYDALARQDYPFEVLLQTLSASRQLLDELPPLIFNYARIASPESTFGAEPVPIPRDRVIRCDWDLTLLDDASEAITANFVYNQELFEESTIDRAWQAYARALSSIPEGLDHPVSRLLGLIPPRIDTPRTGCAK